jgi:hypothetical protein
MRPPSEPLADPLPANIKKNTILFLHLNFAHSWVLNGHWKVTKVYQSHGKKGRETSTGKKGIKNPDPVAIYARR